MRNVIDVAHYVVQQCATQGSPVSNLQLQKILYYIQGYFLKKYHRFAFDENLYCWTYGPVSLDAYFEFNVNGNQKIRSDNKSIPSSLFDRPEKELIDDILNKCVSIPSSKLVEMTHNEAPWNDTGLKEVIDPSLIQDFFIKHDPLEIDK